MKLFKTSIFALAALLSLGLVACNDDVEYVPGAQSDGVYFAGNPSTISIAEDATSFTVSVARTSSTAAASYEVTSTDPSGLFTIPTSVTFDGASVNSDLVVSYDPAELEYDVPYSLSFQLDGVSDYGNGSYSVVVTKSAPMITDASKATTGDYTYTAFFSGLDPDLDVEYQYNKYDENQVVYTVHHWGYDVDLAINVDFSQATADGYVPVYVPEVYIGYDHSSYGPVYMSDIYTYLVAHSSAIPSGYTAEDFMYESYYDMNTGTFYITTVYYVSAGIFGSEIETLQLAGFPDYSVSVEYKGVFTDADETQTQAVASISVGADATAKVALASGTDYQSLIQGIVAGTVSATELSAGENQTVSFNIRGAGQYTIAAVSYNGDEAQNAAYQTFKINSGTVENDDDDWETIGLSEIVDGWLCAGLTYEDGTAVDPYDLIYVIETQENKYTPGLYRLVNMYGDDSPVASLNENTKTTYVEIDLTDPECVCIVPQYSGFTSSGIGDFYIGNIEGYYYNQGETKESIKETIKPEYLSSFEDGVIVVPYPFWGCALTNDEFGYTWTNDPYASEIALPIDESTRAPKAISVKAKKGTKKISAARVSAKAKKQFTSIKAYSIVGQKAVKSHRNTDLSRFANGKSRLKK